MFNLEVADTVYFLDGVDFVPAQVVLSLTGAILSMWYMQIASNCSHEPRIVWCARRFGVFLIAASLLWSVVFAYYRVWQPWPPYVLLLFGLNLALLAAIIRDAALRKGFSVPAE